MRKITKLAVKAFINSTAFNQTNTEVTHSALHFEDGKQVGRNASYMRLFGNLIARSYYSNQHVLQVNFCGYPTPTTKERLNGVFSALDNSRPFHTVKGVLMYKDKPIDDTVWLTFHFVGGRWALK